MSAIVTDQFRINNAGNFLGDVNNTANSYYVFVGLSTHLSLTTQMRLVEMKVMHNGMINPLEKLLLIVLII